MVDSEETEAVEKMPAEEEKKRTIGKYDMGIVLGAGAFCKVRALRPPQDFVRSSAAYP